MPWTYRHSTKEFRSFLEDARDRMGLTSINHTYTAVEGVLITFRRRLTVREGLSFADTLPSSLRALFVARWNVSEPKAPFTDRAAMTREAQALRPNHNNTPENAIEATAWALRRHVRQDEFDRALAALPEGAEDFWRATVDDLRTLEQRII